MYDNMNMHSWNFMGMHILMWGFWALIIVLIVWALISLLGKPKDPHKGQPTAREILDVRYAKGEIDQEEYQRLRRDIDKAEH